VVAAVGIPESARRGLICEADPVVAESLARRLCGWGYLVGVAADGLAALEVALRLRPSFVLLSLELPVLDGWDVARTLSRVATFRAPRLIAMSTCDDHLDHASLVRVGFASHVKKPVSAFAVKRVLHNPSDSPVIDATARHRRG
jgi:CheY-like chemotaxis protein